MKKIFLLVLTLTFLGFMTVSRVSVIQAAGPIVWTLGSLDRMSQTGAAGTTTTATLYAAKGESESFQVVIKGPSGGLTNVNVIISDLSDGNGHTIAKSNTTLYREHYVNVVSSPNWGGSNQPHGAGWYADGLIPFVDPRTGTPLNGQLKAVPFNLPQNQNQPIWIDIFVPRNTEAGIYTGTMNITSSQGNVAVPVSLTVWNFILPLKPALKSAFLVWTAGSTINNQELLRHRLAPENVNTADERMLIDNYGLGLTSTGFWSGADIGTCSMSAAPSAAQFQSAAAKHQPDILLYAYTADEIDNCSGLYPTIKQWAANMHQSRIKNLIVMAPVTELFDDGTGTGRSAVDIWVVLPFQYDSHVSVINSAKAKGDEVWSYNCLVQDSYSPKWEVDFSLMDYRIHPGFINQSVSLTGLLYWRIDKWTSDPWNNVNTYSGGYPGDGMLVYPGEQVGLLGLIVPSMRLKALRDGVDDYDYIELLKQKNQGTWALQLARTVGPDWKNWTRDPQVLESVRIQLGNKIHELNSGSASPTPTPSSSPTFAKGDVNHSGGSDAVNLEDILLVLGNYGKNPSQVVGYHDPVGDGKINGVDFAHVIRDWSL